MRPVSILPCPGSRAHFGELITVKTPTFIDPQGRTLLRDVVRPGRMHGQTSVRTEGIAEQLHQHPKVKVEVEVDEGHQGLANEFPGQVSAPPEKPKDDAPPGEHHARCEQGRRQSSARI